MADVWHLWNGDVASGPTGDLLAVDGTAFGQQRVLRRLLTNPGDYIWQLDYGAGLARFIGETIDEARIRAVIRGQIFKEAAVGRTPEPVIDVLADTGTVTVHIRYADAATGQTQVLAFSVNG